MTPVKGNHVRRALAAAGLLLYAALPACATTQEPEILILGGETLKIRSYPLEAVFEADTKRPGEAVRCRAPFCCPRERLISAIPAICSAAVL